MVEASSSQVRAALGANADHYERRFTRIAAAGHRWMPGWNSAAFLHSTAWFFYRRMYVLALLNLLAPWALLIALAVVAPRSNLDTVALVVFAIYVGTVFILLPVFADAIYYRHLLARLPKARPPSAWTALGATALIFAYFGLFLATLLPAYGDYAPQAKVSEAILASYTLRSEITAFYGEQRRLPNAAEAARLARDPDSKRVQSISYDAGSRAIVVTMRDPFPGKRFALRAIEEADQLSWKCSTIDLQKKYLPASCRD